MSGDEELYNMLFEGKTEKEIMKVVINEQDPKKIVDKLLERQGDGNNDWIWLSISKRRG